MTHPELVKALMKPGKQILQELTPATIEALHMAVGICGEAGELIDAVKKNSLYNKPLDRANVVEELGDLEFYMEGLRQILTITREETLQANIDKLSIRYSKMTFSNEAAQQRADKAPIVERHHPQCECVLCRPNQPRTIPIPRSQSQ